MAIYLSLTDELRAKMDASGSSVTDWRVVYGRPLEGDKVSILVPSPNGPSQTAKTISEFWEWITTRGVDVPDGSPYLFMDVADIPTDRTFRDAWRFNSTTGIELPLPNGSTLYGSGINDAVKIMNTTGSVWGLDGNDQLVAVGNYSNNLYGGPGDDWIESGGGDDTVDGGSGDDIIIGGDGAGNDSYSGGTGTDTVKYTSAKAAITVDLVKGNATSTAGKDAAKIGTDTLSGIESVIAGKYNDIIKGSNLSNVLVGGLGTDSLYGGADNVRDVFDFDNITESKIGTARDKVYNFISGVDDIDLKTIDANTKVSGNQEFKFLSTKAGANSLWYVIKDVDRSNSTSDIVIYGDVNGDAKADFEIGLVSVNSITVGDFIL